MSAVVEQTVMKTERSTARLGRSRFNVTLPAPKPRPVERTRPEGRLLVKFAVEMHLVPVLFPRLLEHPHPPYLPRITLSPY